MKEINLAFGRRLYVVRKERRLTREQLAERISVSPRFLADVEYGKTGVSLQTLTSLCRALQVTADYLLGLETSEQTDERRQLQVCMDRLDEAALPYVREIVDVITRMADDMHTPDT